MESAAPLPKAVPDIRAWTLYEKPEGNLYCVGSLERDKYIAVPADRLLMVLDFAALLDGTRTLVAAASAVEEKFGQKVDAEHLFRLLSSANLIEIPAPPQIFQGEFRRLSIDLLTWDVRHFFERFGHAAQKLSQPLLGFSVVVVLLGLLSLDERFFSSQNIYKVGDSFLLGYLALALGSIFSLLCHELAHALVAAANGATTRTIRVALYLGFIPYFYTEIAGMYTLTPARRIYIWLAGGVANLVLAGLGLIAYRWLGGALTPAASQVLTKFCLANFFTIIGNLSPLMPTDGYFILSTLLKKVNIRTNAFTEFTKWLRREKHSLRGGILVYFLLTGSVILFSLGMQFHWLAGILDELIAGRLGLASFQSQIYLFIFFGVAVLRLLVVFLVGKRRKLTS